MMDIIESSRKYETWLGEKLLLVPADLESKHKAMCQAVFPFLRATFYRWVQLWPEICPDLVNAPRVLAVGDLHIENFGTWRDREGRPVWGINDFDEAFSMFYTNDLVRLACSAIIAAQENVLGIHPRDACDSILNGYTKCLNSQRGQPFVLSEEHLHLRDLALNTLRDPIHFWDKLGQNPALNDIPAQAFNILQGAMPEPNLEITVVHRAAGLGSLGRERYTAIVKWGGGKIAREIKPLTVSAALWEKDNGELDGKIQYQNILDHAVRNPDPFTHLVDQWILRRLAPDCSRIELSDLPHQKDEIRLLEAMGWETANVHLGSGTQTALQILEDLNQRPADWLLIASQGMSKATIKDWEVWKNENGLKTKLNLK